MRTSYGYDALSRQNVVIEGDGLGDDVKRTITTTFDALDRVTKIERGLYDTQTKTVVTKELQAIDYDPFGRETSNRQGGGLLKWHFHQK
jgi:hypothetical protein